MAEILDVIAKLSFDLNSAGLTQAQQGVSSLGRSFQELSKLNAAQRNELKGQLGVLDELRLKEQRLLELREKANSVTRVKQFNDALQQTRSQITGLTNAAANLDKPSAGGGGGFLSSIVGGNLIAGGISTLVSSIGAVGTEILSTTANFEKFGVVLENSLGKTAGKEAFEQIKEFTAKTPFQLEEVTGSYIKLINRGFKPTTEELTKIGDLASSQGKSFEQLTEAILDAQTGEFERLKEFGIKASKNGDTVRLSFKGITKEVANTDEAIRNAVLGFGDLEGIVGANAKISATLEGKYSNLKDNLGQLAGVIGNQGSPALKGFLDLANDAVATITDWLDTDLSTELEAEQESLQGLAAELSDTNISAERRNEIYRQLNELYPSYFSNLDTDKLSNNDLLKAINEVNNALLRRIEIEKGQEEVTEKSKDVNKTIQSIASANLRIRKALFDGLTADGARSISDAGRIIDEVSKRTNGNLAQTANIIKSTFDIGFFNEDIITRNVNLSTYLKRLLDEQNDALREKALLQVEINRQNGGEIADREKLAEQLRDISKIDSIKRVDELIGLINNFKNGRQIFNNELEKLNQKKSELLEKSADQEKQQGDRAQKERDKQAQKERELQEKRLSALESFKDQAKKLRDEIADIEVGKDTEKDIEKKYDRLALRDKEGVEKRVKELRKDGLLTKSIEDEAGRVKLLIDEKYKLLRIKDVEEFNKKRIELLNNVNDFINEAEIKASEERIKNGEKSLDNELKLNKIKQDRAVKDVEERYKKELDIIEDFKKKSGGNADELDKAANAEKKLAESKQATLLNIEKEARNNALKILDNYVEDYIKVLDEALKDEELAIETSYLERLAIIQTNLNDGLITEEKYSEQIEKLNKDKAKEISAARIDGLNKELNKVEEIILLYQQLAVAGIPLPISKEEFEKLAKRAKELKNEIAKEEVDATKPDNTEEKAKKAEITLSNLKQATDSLFSGISDALEFELDKVDGLIKEQTERVEKYRQLADNGQAEQYEKELKRLDNLEKERTKIAQRQILVNQLLAVSNGIVAISEQAKLPFPLNAIAIAGTITSLVVGLAAAKQQLSQNKFYKGSKYVTDSTVPDGIDTVPSMLTKGERVVTVDNNRKYFDIYNAIEENPIFAGKVKELYYGKGLNYNTRSIQYGGLTKDAGGSKSNGSIVDVSAIVRATLQVRDAIEKRPNKSTVITSKGVSRMVESYKIKNNLRKSW